jgi:Tol biopolymer transport system component
MTSRTRRFTLSVLLVTATGLFATASQAATPQTVRVTVSTTGVQQNRDATFAEISGDGNLVVFAAQAANLVPSDTNNKSDIFLRDITAGSTHRVSISTSGKQSTGPCYDPSISADGRYIVFSCASPNLVANDTNQTWDIYLRDTVSHTLTRVSTSAAGGQANGQSSKPEISRDGRFVVFYSFATNLVGNDHNTVSDVFRKNLQTGAIQRVSVSSTGIAGDRDSAWPQISPTGRYVAFESDADNLVSNEFTDFAYHHVYVRDTQAGTTTMVDQTPDGAGGNGDGMLTGYPFSEDGRYILFTSRAFNLIQPLSTGGNESVYLRDMQAGVTTQIDFNPKSTGPIPGFGGSAAGISSDGRFVLWDSGAAGIVPGDTCCYDVFMTDRQTHTTTLVSRSSSGVPGNFSSGGGDYSADGQYFVFYSEASNLVANDTNNHRDLFVRGPLH